MTHIHLHEPVPTSERLRLIRPVRKESQHVWFLARTSSRAKPVRFALVKAIMSRRLVKRKQAWFYQLVETVNGEPRPAKPASSNHFNWENIPFRIESADPMTL